MINNLVRKAIQPTEDFKAYCYFYDGIFENMLTSIPNVSLYGDFNKSHYKWKNYFNYISDSVYNLNLKQIPYNDITFDAVICNSRIQQAEQAKKTAQYLNVPLIIIDHNGPDNKFNKLDIDVIIETYSGNHYISTNSSAAKWNNTNHIPYYVEIPQHKKDYVNDYIIYGNFNPSDRLLIQEICNELKGKYIIINDNMSYEQIEQSFLESKVYIHIPTSNTISYELLLAMACGCGIVSSTTDAVKDIITDEINGILIKNSDEVAPMACSLMKDNMKRAMFAHNNIELLEKQYSKEKFIYNWTKELSIIKRMLFVP